jgi:hypothetical protein
VQDKPLLEREETPGAITVDGITRFIEQLVDPESESIDFSTLIERVRQSRSGRVVEVLKEWLDAVRNQRS